MGSLGGSAVMIADGTIVIARATDMLRLTAAELVGTGGATATRGAR